MIDDQDQIQGEFMASEAATNDDTPGRADD